MPYNSIVDLPDEVKDELPAEAQKLFLGSFNSAWDGTCKDKTDREACAFTVAWRTVKKQYKQQDGKWIRKAAAISDFQHFKIASADESKLLISGPLIEIGKKNLNGWGIERAEVAAILESIVGAPLKKCDGFASIIDGHSCDYNWTNRDYIGIVVAAFEKDGWIHVSAEVRDSTAVSKIMDKVWARKWSVFVAHDASKTNSGMVEGVIPLSVTLVTNPAYPAAGFEVQAGAGAIPNKIGDSMEEDPEKGNETYTKEQVDKLVAAALEKQKADYEDKLKTLGAEHQTALDKLKADHEVALTAASEQHRQEQDKMVPRAEVETMVAAAVKQAQDSTMDLLERQRLSVEIVNAQAAAGMIKDEDKPALIEKLQQKSAEALKEDMNLLEKVQTALKSAGENAVNKFKESILPAAGVTERPKLNWNAIKKEWS